MKICIIGNTHVAALKSGWDLLKSNHLYSDIQLDFFAAPRNGIDSLYFDNGIFRTDDDGLKKNLIISSQGKDEIVINDYDCFVLHGLISFNKVARVFVAGAKNGFDFVEKLITESVGYRLRQNIYSSRIPVVLSTEPMFSQRVMASENNYGYDKFVNQDLILSDAGRLLLERWKSCVNEFDILEQPSETIIGSVFTKSEFMSKESDNLHMNSEYGVKVIDNIIKKCAGLNTENVMFRGRGGNEFVSAGVDNDFPVNPYSNLPEKSYWKLAVVDKDPSSLKDFYTKRFSLSGMQIATAGSCFAQEIAKGLRKNGYAVLDKEPSPNTLEIRGDLETRYGYKLYSARHGNIYTVRQLLQLTKEALGLVEYPSETYVWEKNGRYFDAFRPGVEPDGLESADEVVLQRKDHIRRFESVIKESDVFVFTMGLTETWMHKSSGLVFPTAPGVIAGNFDPKKYKFVNFSYQEILDDFIDFRKLFKSVNPDAKFIITVSPVPLTATAENTHVLVSTIRSKSILRAVAAQLYESFKDIDYFPSYELFSTPFLGASLFNDNRRTVKKEGVEAVMNIFFGEHGIERDNCTKSDKIQGDPLVNNDDLVCEEALLEAFAPERIR